MLHLYPSHHICHFKCFVLLEVLYASYAYAPYLSVHQELRLERLFALHAAIRGVTKLAAFKSNALQHILACFKRYAHVSVAVPELLYFAASIYH